MNIDQIFKATIANNTEELSTVLTQLAKIYHGEQDFTLTVTRRTQVTLEVGTDGYADVQISKALYESEDKSDAREFSVTYHVVFSEDGTIEDGYQF